jgi:hypothetical protein
MKYYESDAFYLIPATVLDQIQSIGDIMFKPIDGDDNDGDEVPWSLQTLLEGNLVEASDFVCVSPPR